MGRRPTDVRESARARGRGAAIVVVPARGHLSTPRRDHATAETLLRRALAMEPDNDEFHHNLGSVLQPSRPLEAVEHFRRALAIDPLTRTPGAKWLMRCGLPDASTTPSRSASGPSRPMATTPWAISSSARARRRRATWCWRGTSWAGPSNWIRRSGWGGRTWRRSPTRLGDPDGAGGLLPALALQHAAETARGSSANTAGGWPVLAGLPRPGSACAGRSS